MNLFTLGRCVKPSHLARKKPIWRILAYGEHSIREISNLQARSPHDIHEDESVTNLVSRYCHVGDMGHQMLVIQPYVKWGPNKLKITTPDLQLAEAVALVETLPDYKVVKTIKIGLETLGRKSVFGEGNLQILKDTILENEQITAVFMSMSFLTNLQQFELENALQIPVLDRYKLVLKIFEDHAKSKEAKLQIALARIPFIRSRIGSLGSYGINRPLEKAQFIGGGGETTLDTQRQLLLSYESKLKVELEKLKGSRTMLRNKRDKLEIPSIAVVGYTNCGKTSLIKALTGEAEMEPKNYLFATLDVTVHGGKLPNLMKVLYVDTVGFLSDLPTELIASFHATLEDAVNSDLIIHIFDVSHPDIVNQLESVDKTLAALNIDPVLMENIINVGNKVDLADSDKLSKIKAKRKDILFVSATEEMGLDVLGREIEEKLYMTTNRRKIKIRVPSGREAYRWLYKNCTVSSCVADEANSQLSLMEVIITAAQFQKFKSIFSARQSKDS